MYDYYWDILYAFCYATFNTTTCNRVEFDSDTMTYSFYHDDILIGKAHIEDIEKFKKDL